MDPVQLPTLAELRAWVAGQPVTWVARAHYDECPLSQYLTETRGEDWGVEDGLAWPIEGEEALVCPLGKVLNVFVSHIDTHAYGPISRDAVVAILDTLLREEVYPCG